MNVEGEFEGTLNGSSVSERLRRTNGEDDLCGVFVSEKSDLCADMC
jgi:hypothetical protein